MAALTLIVVFLSAPGTARLRGTVMVAEAMAEARAVGIKRAALH